MPERYVAVGEEATYAPATPVTPSEFFAANHCEAALSHDHAFKGSMRGRSIYEHREGYIAEAVTINMDVKPENNIGWFLKWILGDVSSQKVSTNNAYQHTFKSQDLLRSFALGYNWDTIKEKRVPGCIMTSLKLATARGNAPLVADITALGQTESLETVQTPSGWCDLAPFKPYQSKVELADAELQNLVEGFSVTIANKVYGVSDIGVLGSRKLPRIELSERVVTGTMDLPNISGTLDVYQRFLEDTAKTEPGEPVVPFKLELLTDTGILIEETYNYALDITLPKCVITSMPPRVELQERKKFTLGFQAMYDGTAQTDIQVDLTNTLTEYADAT